MDPIQAVARGRLLFLEHMSHIRPSVSNEFYSASGLPLERFFDITTIIASYFMLRTREMGGQPKDDMGLFHQEHFEQKDQELGGLFQKYARFACQSPEEFADAVRDSVGTYRALGRIRGRPILRTHDGRCIVMDPVYFAEHVAVGPLFAILGGTTGRESEQCFADFGHAFEHYCSQLFRRMYPASSVLFNRLECPVMGADQDGSLIQIADGCLNDLTDLVLFEFKSAWLPDEFTEADDPSRYLKALQDRYARANGPESPKGAGQLANTITHLANGEWKPKTQDFASTRKILPVLLCHDSRLEAPLHAWFLARQFHSALAPDQEYDNGDMRKGTFRVAGLIVLSVDDLEFLERSVEHFSLTELLRDYSQASPDRMCDMRSFLSISEYRKKVFASGILGESAIAAR